MRGMLIHNGTRPDAAFDDGMLLGGLRRGNCFTRQPEGKWPGVRLEFQKCWLIVYKRPNAQFPMVRGQSSEFPPISFFLIIVCSFLKFNAVSSCVYPLRS